jgi:hypothetical protein
MAKASLAQLFLPGVGTFDPTPNLSTIGNRHTRLKPTRGVY